MNLDIKLSAPAAKAPAPFPPMPRKLLRRWLPAPHRVRSERSLQLLGAWLGHRQLWQLNRRSVARATALGLFMAFVPVPGQMLLAALGAVVLGVNLPVALVMVWVTNPLTFAAIFFGAYRLGAWLLDLPSRHVQFEMSLQWFLTQVAGIWQPLFLGCLILGLISAAVGYVAVLVLWRLHVQHAWRARRARRAALAALNPRPADHRRASAPDRFAARSPDRESPR